MQIDVANARERARRTAHIKGLIEKGQYLILASMEEKDAVLGDQGQELLSRADELREEFWERFPNAYISPNCRFMAKDVSLSE